MRPHPSADPVDRGALYRAVDPVLDDIERHRRGHLLFMIPAIIVLGVPAAVGTALYVAVEGRSFELGVIAGFIMFLFTAYGVFKVLDRDYRRVCKRRFNARLAAAMGMDYKPQGANVKIGDLHPDYILPAYARAVPEDALIFTHKKRRIIVQEVVFHQTGSRENHLFNPLSFHGTRGLLVIIPSRRIFEAHTVVVPRRLFGSDRNRARFMGLENYEYTPFGNLAFKRKYYVMSTAGDYAHFVFDPAFIERVMAFEEVCGARSLSLSFRKGQILIYADHAHDFLETGSMWRRLDLSLADRITAEVQILTGLIDALEINPHVGV